MTDRPDEPLFKYRVRTQVPSAVANALVCIHGLGSLGGTLARTLAQCGACRFILIDPDIFAAENICRHVLDHRDVGRHKVDAMADLLRAINPAVEVRTECFDSTKDAVRFEEIIQSCDIVAGCTDNFNAHLAQNHFCLQHKIPATYGTVFDEGHGGKVIFVDPTSEFGCLYCTEGLNGSRYKERDPNARYTTEPWAALAPFVGSIALEQAWLTLWAIVRKLDGNKMPEPPAPYICTSFVEMFEDDGTLVTQANRNYFEFPPIHPKCGACEAAGRIPAE